MPWSICRHRMQGGSVTLNLASSWNPPFSATCFPAGVMISARPRHMPRPSSSSAGRELSPVVCLRRPEARCYTSEVTISYCPFQASQRSVSCPSIIQRTCSVHWVQDDLYKPEPWMLGCYLLRVAIHVTVWPCHCSAQCVLPGCQHSTNLRRRKPFTPPILIPTQNLRNIYTIVGCQCTTHARMIARL